MATGQRIASPTTEMGTLTLKGFDFLASLPTMTTAKAEATAESNANVTTSMQVCEEEGSIKTNITAKITLLGREREILRSFVNDF
jgi:hypothetical protein